MRRRLELALATGAGSNGAPAGIVPKVRRIVAAISSSLIVHGPPRRGASNRPSTGARAKRLRLRHRRRHHERH